MVKILLTKFGKMRACWQVRIELSLSSFLRKQEPRFAGFGALALDPCLRKDDEESKDDGVL